jgi:hypothetical protein
MSAEIIKFGAPAIIRADTQSRNRLDQIYELAGEIMDRQRDRIKATGPLPPLEAKALQSVLIIRREARRCIRLLSGKDLSI